MIPTAAVGASILRRIYPKVISFALPDQKAGTDFKGKIGEAADDLDETYHSLMTRVFDEHLSPFQKSVIDASSATTAEESDAHFTCDAAFKQESDAPHKPVKGQIPLLGSSFCLFVSPTMWPTRRLVAHTLFLPT